MTEPCKAVVVYKGKQTMMSHHNLNNKGGSHPHPATRHSEVHSRPELEREDIEASPFTGSSSTSADDGGTGTLPTTHQVNISQRCAQKLKLQVGGSLSFSVPEVVLYNLYCTY